MMTLKLDLRVAKVISCEKVPKSKSYLKFVLDIGIEERNDQVLFPNMNRRLWLSKVI